MGYSIPPPRAHQVHCSHFFPQAGGTEVGNAEKQDSRTLSYPVITREQLIYAPPRHSYVFTTALLHNCVAHFITFIAHQTLCKYQITVLLCFYFLHFSVVFSFCICTSIRQHQGRQQNFMTQRNLLVFVPNNNEHVESSCENTSFMVTDDSNLSM